MAAEMLNLGQLWFFFPVHLHILPYIQGIDPEARS